MPHTHPKTIAFGGSERCCTNRIVPSLICIPPNPEVKKGGKNYQLTKKHLSSCGTDLAHITAQKVLN